MAILVPTSATAGETGQTVARAATVGAAPAAAERPRSQVPIARRLAKGVIKAKSDDARFDALRAVMKQLNLGVYEGSGKAVVPGADRSVDDPYLYRFELDMLVGAFGRGDEWTLDQLAAEIEAAGVRPADGSVSADDLAAALRSVTGTAVKRQRSQRSLAMLVVRELGKLHRPGYDLATVAAADDPRFDPLQRTLILADLALAAREEARREASAANAPARAGATSCGDFKRVFRFGAGILGALGADAPFIGDVASVWHAWMVSTGVEVRRVGDTAEYVHYGPGNHDEETAQSKIAGDPLDFTLEVVMLDQRSDREIECGALAGLTVPKKGPIPGVEINWDSTLGGNYDELLRHGNVVREDDQTGPDGRATFIFKPKDEVLVGVGTVEHATGALQPEALVLSSLGNGRAILENIGVAKFATFLWDVSFHPQQATLLMDSVLTLPPEAMALSCVGFPASTGCTTDGQLTIRVLAAIPVQLDPASGAVRGNGELTGLDASGQVSQTYRCLEGDPDTVTTTFTAQGMSPGILDVPSISGGNLTAGPSVDLALSADGGQPAGWQSYPKETYHLTRTGTGDCSTLNTDETRQQGAWYGNFYGAHRDELDNQYVLRLKDFAPSGDGFVKHYQRTVAVTPAPGYTYNVTENTTIELHPRG